MPPNDSDPSWWFSLSRHDSDTVEILRKNGGYPEIILYHCHQAIEKALKGIMLEKGIPLLRTHDLERMYSMIRHVDPGFPDCTDEIIGLHSFYSQLRYPHGDALDSSGLERGIDFYVRLKEHLTGNF